MTRLLSKKTALAYKVKRNDSCVALSLVYALRNKKQLSQEHFETLEKSVRAGRLFYNKKLKSLIK